MNEFEWWLINFRSDELTNFLTIAPFATSSIFYMSIIALGFWLRPGGKTFSQLGALLPLAILFNLILKNSFSILRPDEEFHLIEVSSMLGFPCTEIMIATVFWGMIALKWQKIYSKALSISIITLVLVSRMYLGVSSLAASVAGLAFGSLIIIWWRSDFMQNIYYKWLNKQRSSYWVLLCSTLALYFLSSRGNVYSQDFVVATGALIGFGVSLSVISKWRFELGMFSAAHISSVVMSYLMLAVLSKVIPTIMLNQLTKVASGILEYSLLVFMVYCIFPRLQRSVARQQYNSK